MDTSSEQSCLSRAAPQCTTTGLHLAVHSHCSRFLVGKHHIVHHILRRCIYYYPPTHKCSSTVLSYSYHRLTEDKAAETDLAAAGAVAAADSAGAMAEVPVTVPLDSPSSYCPAAVAKGGSGVPKAER